MSVKNLLKGKKVKLTAFTDEDITELERWYNDIYFLRFYDMVVSYPHEKSELKEMISSIRRSNNEYIFAIRTIQDNKLIGITGFEDILWNNGTGVIYIGIGKQEYRGRGFAKEALYLTMEFGFEELNLNRIQLNVIEYNKSAIGLYEKLGFKKEGVYREFIHRDGTRYDMYLYGILRNEWDSIYKIYQL
ncbi:N-acetyltransferase [Clostridium fermenticellae]|uniref:N-acetyltransferase n=1 Tax=Clostridium fermenticellae TaxID=2068654 RepID=A0A386H2S7_9CLOT|nr:GNAT family protein [Clostridium fermenticellae]AYD39954.1 N-acetyltransferase [Clostridium fermenticellae]